MRRLFLDETPLLDLRAPIEFARGAFPASVNLPLMNDAERARLGTVYRQEGTEAALQLGHELVSGAVREARISSWVDFVQKHPDARLYCRRGGQRSAIAEAWLQEAGFRVPRIEGGYRHIRTWLMAELARLAGACSCLVLAGQTGSGKTEVLQQFAAALDLEALAGHRGSAFGGLLDEQPPPASFQHQLTVQLMHQEAAGRQQLLLEDESRLIGRLEVPKALFAKMQKARLVLLDVPLEERVELTRLHYIDRPWQQLKSGLPGGETGIARARFAASLRQALARIQRRLGGLHYGRARQLMDEALAKPDAKEAHQAWIRLLLVHYYDPMYRHQLAQKSDRIQFRGDRKAVLQYLSRHFADKES